jgi:NTP pyrophosphatase (non-canonical NTP hydrolase)
MSDRSLPHASCRCHPGTPGPTGPDPSLNECARPEPLAPTDDVVTIATDPILPEDDLAYDQQQTFAGRSRPEHTQPGASPEKWTPTDTSAFAVHTGKIELLQMVVEHIEDHLQYDYTRYPEGSADRAELQERLDVLRPELQEARVSFARAQVNELAEQIAAITGQCPEAFIATEGCVGYVPESTGNPSAHYVHTVPGSFIPCPTDLPITPMSPTPAQDSWTVTVSGDTYATPAEASTAPEMLTEAEQAIFTLLLEKIQAYLHATAVDKGWWDKERNDGEMLCLIHAEVSEALESLRHGDPASDHIPDFSGVEEEFADVFIRILDMCAARDWRIAQALFAKLAFNDGRPYKHGGKAF